MAVIVLLLAAGCGGEDGPTREVGSAGLLSYGYVSYNVAGIAINVGELSDDDAALHVYLGAPGEDAFVLPAGTFLVELVSPEGDKLERLESIDAGEREIEVPAFASIPESSEERRSENWSAAVTFVDFSIVFRLGMLQVEEILTDGFTKVIDDPEDEITDDEYDRLLDIMNGLSEYEELIVKAMERLVADTQYPEYASNRASREMVTSPGILLGPNNGFDDAMKAIKDFFTGNGKSGNDTKSRNVFVGNTNPLSPQQKRELFDQVKNDTKDNTNVKNFGGITETDPDAFFQAVRDGKYDKIAQDIEKAARSNPDYAQTLQQNQQTPNDRGKKEGGEALKAGGKVIKESIDTVIPGPAGKVVKGGEKINDLLAKKGTPPPSPNSTATPYQPPVTQAATQAPAATAALTPPPGAPPTSPPPAPPTMASTAVPTPAPTQPPTAAPTAPPTATPSTATGTPTASLVPATSAPPPITDTLGPTGLARDQSPREPINEITDMAVFFAFLDDGDLPNTKSYRIDVRVKTIVRTEPAAMVSCGYRGHDVGSSALFPGETFTIPLFRIDLYPAQDLEITCSIRKGNSITQTVRAPGTPIASQCPTLRRLDEEAFVHVGWPAVQSQPECPTPTVTTSLTESPSPTEAATPTPPSPTEAATPTPPRPQRTNCDISFQFCEPADTATPVLPASNE